MKVGGKDTRHFGHAPTRFALIFTVDTPPSASFIVENDVNASVLNVISVVPVIRTSSSWQASVNVILLPVVLTSDILQFSEPSSRE